MLIGSWTEIESTKGGLDLFKEVLWVSVDQRAAVLWAVKLGLIGRIFSKNFKVDGWVYKIKMILAKSGDTT